MTVKAILIGAGGFGREALDVVEAHNANHESDDTAVIHVLGVVDDAPSDVNVTRISKRGYSLLGDIDYLLSRTDSGYYILGIGSPKVRQHVAERLENSGWSPLTITHPSAVIGSADFIGSGSIICGGVQLSTNTRIGRHVHLNPNSTIGHDTILEDFVSVNPGAIISGHVLVKECTLVGAGAVILQELEIGSFVVIGAAACVIDEVKSGETVVGIPARNLARKNK